MIHWPTLPLDRCIGSIRAGVSLGGEDRVPGDGEVGILTLGAVSSGRFLPDQCKALPATAIADLGHSVRAGTLLMSRSNTIDLVGSTVLAAEDHPRRFLPDLVWEIQLRDDSPVSAPFLADFLATDAGRRLLQSAAMGTSGSMKKLSMRRLRRLAVPVLPAHLQQRWEKARTAFDKLQTTEDEFITSKQKLLRGLAHALLTGRQRFPEFMSHDSWSNVQLGQVLDCVSEPVEWNDSATYRLASIRRRNAGLFHRETRKGADIKTKSLFTIRVGDFLISRMQAVHGALAVVPPEFDGYQVSGMYLVLRPKSPERIRTTFLHYVSQLGQMYRNVLTSCHGVHIEKMTFDPDRFMKTKVLIPPTLYEQDRVTAAIMLLDHEIILLEKHRATYGTLKRALMQRLLSGDTANLDPAA